MAPAVGYEARYGPSGRNVLMMIVCSVFVVAIPLMRFGIVLGVLGEIRHPFQPESKWLSARWPEVEAIVLWQQPIGAQSMQQIGIRRSGDAPGALNKISRPVNGWRLDRERLVAAVHRFAPETTIVDRG